MLVEPGHAARVGDAVEGPGRGARDHRADPDDEAAAVDERRLDAQEQEREAQEADQQRARRGELQALPELDLGGGRRLVDHHLAEADGGDAGRRQREPEVGGLAAPLPPQPEVPGGRHRRKQRHREVQDGRRPHGGRIGPAETCLEPRLECREMLLLWLLVGGALGYAGGRVFLGYPAAPGFRVLARREVAFLNAAADAIYPPGAGLPSGPEARVAESLDGYLEIVPPRMRRLMRLLFLLVEHATLLFAAPPPRGRRRFSSLAPEQRAAALDGWRTSPLFPRRLVFSSLRALLTNAYVADPAVLRGARPRRRSRSTRRSARRICSTRRSGARRPRSATRRRRRRATGRPSSSARRAIRPTPRCVRERPGGRLGRGARLRASTRATSARRPTSW